MSELERPERLSAERKITVDDIRELKGASTPHFALQIGNRIRRLIEDLPHDDPARIEGEQEISRLEKLATQGERRGPAHNGEHLMPSLGSGIVGRRRSS